MTRTPASGELLPAVHACLDALGLPRDVVDGRALPLFDDATELVVAQIDDDGREHLLTPAAASAWHRLREAASADDISLHIVSAFRGFERQRQIIAAKCARGLSAGTIFSVSAPPGCSEHHSGRAVDVGTPDEPPLEESFESTAAFDWLVRRAPEFGFSLSYPRDNPQGFAYEPWHWCFHPEQEK